MVTRHSLRERAQVQIGGWTEMKSRLLAWLLIVGTLSSVLVGCTASQGPAKPERAERDTIVWAGQAEPKTLDPHDTTDMVSAMVQRHVFEGLFDFDEKCNIVPELVDSYTVSEDATVWTFDLKKGVKFHDGDPFNAEAVKINLERVMDPNLKLARRSLFAADIKEIKVLGEHKLEIVLNKPFGAFIANLAHYAGKFHSPSSLRKYGNDVARNPVGTGPFRFVEWIPGDRIVLEANPEYWGVKPKVKRIVYRPVPEDASRAMQLEAGDVDVAYPLAVQDIQRIRSNPNLVVQSVPSMTNLHFQINTLHKPLDDKRVRQALNYALDLKAICDKIYQGEAVPLDSPISPALWGYAPVGKYKYDPDRARQLLKEAGVEPGKLKLKMYVPEGRYLMAAQVSEAVAGYLADVGVGVEMVKLEWATYLDLFKKGPEQADHDLLMLGWAPSTGDPDWGMRPLFHSKMWAPTNYNSSFYANPQVDELLEKAMRAASPEERLSLYKEAQAIIMDDAPWLFLVAYNVAVGHKKELKNVWVQALDQCIVRGAYYETR